MPHGTDSPNDRAVRATAQRMKSLQSSGVTHLPKRKRAQPSTEAKTPAPAPGADPAGGGANDPIGVNDPVSEAATSDQAAALEGIRRKVAACVRCKELAETRTQTVFGVGAPDARLVFLGEAPGADEDRQGIPFVGRAGKLLTAMIQDGMKIPRESIYIMNILRCRPPGNRNPDPVEAAACREYLDAQLAVIRPEFVCCLGTVAAQNLLDSTEAIGRMRGRLHDYRGIKVICTYHPAYLLRNPAAKAKTWEDLQLLMAQMELQTPNQ